MSGYCTIKNDAEALIARFREGSAAVDYAEGVTRCFRGANAIGDVFREDRRFQEDLPFAREVIRQCSAAYRFASEAAHADDEATMQATCANTTLLQYASDSLLTNKAFMKRIHSACPGAVSSVISDLQRIRSSSRYAANPENIAQLQRIAGVSKVRPDIASTVGRVGLLAGKVVLFPVKLVFKGTGEVCKGIWHHKAAIVKTIAGVTLVGLGYWLGSRK